MDAKFKSTEEMVDVIHMLHSYPSIYFTIDVNAITFIRKVQVDFNENGTLTFNGVVYRPEKDYKNKEERIVDKLCDLKAKAEYNMVNPIEGAVPEYSDRCLGRSWGLADAIELILNWREDSESIYIP